MCSPRFQVKTLEQTRLRPKRLGVVLQLRVRREDHEVRQAEDDHRGVLGRRGRSFMELFWK
jgi:hypothetical protein